MVASLLLLLFLAAVAAFTPFDCINPGTCALGVPGACTTTVKCDRCDEDQRYTSGPPVYCPADTCVCASGTGYSIASASHCRFGWSGMTLSNLNQGADRLYACTVPAHDFVCSGHGTELDYSFFTLPYVVGFWIQGTPTAPQITNGRTDLGTYLNNRCACDTFWFQGPSGKNCNDLPPCPLQNGGTACGGGLIGFCDNSTAPSQCKCSQNYGDTASPPEHCCPRFRTRTQLVVTPSSPVCGGRGVCTSTGRCQCNSGLAGFYCCPTTAEHPTVGCDAAGTCNPDGTCTCNTGFTGAACDINNFCPTDDPSQECSNNGICRQFTQIESAILRANFPQPTGIGCDSFNGFVNPDTCLGFTVPSSTKFTQDAAAAAYIIRLYKFALLNDVSRNTTLSFWNQMFQACTAAGSSLANRPQCFRNINLAVASRGDLSKVLSRPRYVGGRANLWVTDTLKALYPNLAFFDTTVTSLIITAVTSPTAANQATALALLMAYDTFINWYDPALRVSIPAIGSWYCECNVEAGSFGSSGPILPGGPACSATCRSNHELVLARTMSLATQGFSAYQSCTGWVEGVFHGICNLDNTCSCSIYWGGPDCSASVAGFCLNTSIPNAFPCTATGNGFCKTTVLDVSTFTLTCQCTTPWTGKYCQYSICALPGVSDAQRQLECSRLGICQSNGLCRCDVSGQLALSTSRSQLPVLPVGQDCSRNGITQCGVFVPGSLNHNVGTWIECNGHGSCVYNSTANNSTCVCDPGNFGTVCQFDFCDPDCPDNAECDITTGTCHCLFAWSGANCDVSRCGNGIPSLDGSECLCDLHWTTDLKTGLCTVIQCPLVFYTTHGPQLCGPDDTLCTPGQDVTLAKCCYDACEPGRCLLNQTLNSVTCLCDPPLAYTQVAGVCYPICNGAPYFIINNKITCDCSGVPYNKAAGQFVDAFCDVFTCLNGGIALTGGCQCQPGFSDQVCGTPDCAPFGVLDDSGDFCNCFAPTTHPRNGTFSDLCTANTCGVAGATVVQNSTGDLVCQCPTGYKPTLGSQQCIAKSSTVAISSSGTHTTSSSSSSTAQSRASSSSSTGSANKASSSSAGAKGTKSSSSSSTGHTQHTSSSSSAAAAAAAPTTGLNNNETTEFVPRMASDFTIMTMSVTLGVVGGLFVAGGIAAVVISTAIIPNVAASEVPTTTTTVAMQMPMQMPVAYAPVPVAPPPQPMPQPIMYYTTVPQQPPPPMQTTPIQYVMQPIQQPQPLQAIPPGQLPGAQILSQL